MLKTIFKTATFKQSQTTVIGTIINGGLGAIFYILVARFLGPSDFGLLTVSIATLTMIADIADFGTNTGLVRYVSANINNQEEKAFKYLLLGLKFKLAVWVFVLVLGFFLSPFIAKNVFDKEALMTPLRLSMIGVGGALLFSYTSSALQAFQKYFTWGFVNITINCLRLIIILMLLYFGSLNLYSGLVSYVVIPFFGFLLTLSFLPIGKIIIMKNELTIAKEFFSYNLWVAVFTIIAAVSSRLDTFLSARFLSSFEIGLYGAATQLVSVIVQLDSALGVVVAPKFSSFRSTEQMMTYFKKLQFLVLGLALLGILVIPFILQLIPAIYGQQYFSARVPFIILLVAMLVFLISLPTHSTIIYFFGRPNVFVWVSLGHLFIIAVFGYFLISNFRVTGAALTVLIGMFFNFLAPLGWLLYKIGKTKGKA